MDHLGTHSNLYSMGDFLYRKKHLVSLKRSLNISSDVDRTIPQWRFSGVPDSDQIIHIPLFYLLHV